MLPADFLPAGFETIDLAQMNRLHQGARLDIKYLLPLDRAAVFLEGLLPHYAMLEINGRRDLSYATRYFDTAGLAMYLAHHNGRLGRYKVRERCYLDGDACFLEVKRKGNTGHTSKQRVPWTWNAPLEEAAAFIAAACPYRAQELRPTLTVNYRRLTLVHKPSGERITVDTGLRFEHGVSSYNFSKFAVVELKQLERSRTPAVTMLRGWHQSPLSFSKYCFGISRLYPAVKKNNFKERFSAITHA